MSDQGVEDILRIGKQGKVMESEEQGGKSIKEMEIEASLGGPSQRALQQKARLPRFRRVRHGRRRPSSRAVDTSRFELSAVGERQG